MTTIPNFTGNYLHRKSKVIHPNEPLRAKLYREAYDKEYKRRDREKLLRDIQKLIQLNRVGNTDEIEDFIIGEKINLLEYNKRITKELHIMDNLGEKDDNKENREIIVEEWIINCINKLTNSLPNHKEIYDKNF